MTVVFSVAELLPVTKSVVLVLMLTVFEIIVPEETALLTFTVNVKTVDAPEARVVDVGLQVIVPVPLIVGVMQVQPAGTPSD